jgi:L-aminopeptidase/D-esterase-like protein
LSQKHEGFITDVRGIKVGHFTDARRPTGCTVVMYQAGAVTGVDVRGAAPGTRETDLLEPTNTVDKAHAILLAGGSAFGLDAAGGVVRYLEEHNAGIQTRFAKVPIVPAAILYDLSIGDPAIRPDAQSGYQACLNAATGPCGEGSVGAGAGATIGKLAGRPMKGGIGTSSIRLSSGIIVGAIVAVNCVGDVVDPDTGRIMAGARTPDGRDFQDLARRYRSGEWTSRTAFLENTTIGVVATNAALSKPQAARVATMAHDGLARAIRPVHTALDGDTIFAMATGEISSPADADIIGALAADAVTEAILRAVMKAQGLEGYPAYGEIG